jgi:hypothetical protein
MQIPACHFVRSDGKKINRWIEICQIYGIISDLLDKRFPEQEWEVAPCNSLLPRNQVFKTRLTLQLEVRLSQLRGKGALGDPINVSAILKAASVCNGVA